MKFKEILSSILLAKFFIGDKIISKNYNKSKVFFVDEIKKRIHSTSSVNDFDENIKDNKFSKNSSINLFIVSEFGYSYTILYVDSVNKKNSIFDIDINNAEKGSVIEFSKHIQINSRVHLLFLIFYFLGFLSFVLEFYTFFNKQILLSNIQLEYTDFEMSLGYLVIILIWGTLTRLYIEFVVKEKIKKFIHSFEVTFNLEDDKKLK